MLPMQLTHLARITGGRHRNIAGVPQHLLQQRHVGGLIINNQDTGVKNVRSSDHTRLCFASAQSVAFLTHGSSRVKVAPEPGPSLWPVNEPPMSFAASAPAWSPKPRPPARVVS